MRLSDAIRLGALLHPQAFGDYHAHDADGRVIASCALGAAEDAGYRVPRVVVTPQGIHGACPVCGKPQAGPGDGGIPYAVIACLNDTHRWTRDQIADWVELQERPHAAPPARDAPVLVG